MKVILYFHRANFAQFFVMSGLWSYRYTYQLTYFYITISESGYFQLCSEYCKSLALFVTLRFYELFWEKASVLKIHKVLLYNKIILASLTFYDFSFYWKLENFHARRIWVIYSIVFLELADQYIPLSKSWGHHDHGKVNYM